MRGYKIITVLAYLGLVVILSYILYSTLSIHAVLKDLGLIITKPKLPPH